MVAKEAQGVSAQRIKIPTLGIAIESPLTELTERTHVWVLTEAPPTRPGIDEFDSFDSNEEEIARRVFKMGDRAWGYKTHKIAHISLKLGENLVEGDLKAEYERSKGVVYVNPGGIYTLSETYAVDKEIHDRVKDWEKPIPWKYPSLSARWQWETLKRAQIHLHPDEFRIAWNLYPDSEEMIMQTRAGNFVNFDGRVDKIAIVSDNEVFITANPFGKGDQLIKVNTWLKEESKNPHKPDRALAF